MTISLRKQIVIAISVLALGAAAPVGATTFPGENGMVAYTEGYPSRIQAVDPTEGTTFGLASAGAAQPTWSPDGKRVAYVRGGYIFVASAAGKAYYHIPHSKDMSDVSPTWSADGEKLAFVRLKQNGQSAAMSVRVGSQSVTNLSGWAGKKNYRAPSWSPNGKEIVYEEYNASSARLVIKDVDRGTVRELTQLSDVTESSRASWSPNGNKILFRDSTNELYTIWSDGERRSVISDGDSYDGAWSPDGTMIAFIEDPGDESISVSEADGSIHWLSVDTSGYDAISAPTWSPDAAKIVFRMTKGDTTDLWMLDRSTGAQHLLVHNVLDGVSWQALR